MGIADKFQHEQVNAKRAVMIRRLTFIIIGLAFFLFILFYYLLPMWNGPARP